MKEFIYLAVLILFVGAASGCAENQTRIGEGTGVGAGIGALAGGIIGHQTHDTATGVLLGGAIGAAGGAAVGAQIPKEQQQPYGHSNPAINQVTMQQIVDWSRQGISSDEIINRIRTTNSTYSLNSDDISYLRKQGVSQRVIETMQVR